MDSSNLARVRQNVGKMIDQGAGADEIDQYLQSEGTTADQLRRNAGFAKPLPDPRLVDNLPYDPTTGMSTTDLALAGAGKYFVDTARGARQLGVEALASGMPHDPLGLNAYASQLRQQEDERKRLDAPLMATTPGKLGYVGAGATTTTALGALTGPGTVARAVLAPATPLQGAVSGGILSSLNPVGTDDSRTKNVAIGSALGAGANAIAQVPNRLASPMQNRSSNTQLLLDEGVVPTPGQAVNRRGILGRFLAGAEEKAQSLPLIGDIISHARNRAVEDLNKAAVARAGGTGAGYAAIDNAHTALNDTFKSLSQGQSVKLDNTFHVDLSDLTLTDEAKDIIRGKLDNVFNAAKDGLLSGAAYQKFRGELAEAGKKYIRSPLPADHDLGFALSRVADGLDNAFAAQAPATTRQAWGVARDQWANLMRVEDAASRSIGNGGVFTPVQLKQAVRNAGGTSATARGNARMQDLAEAGMSLQSKTPNSGSVDRALMTGLGLGGVAGATATGTLPQLAGTAAGTGLVYGVRPVTQYVVGGYPVQGILSRFLKAPVPAATQAGRLYLQN